jgi:hypothetical protein
MAAPDYIHIAKAVEGGYYLEFRAKDEKVLGSFYFDTEAQARQAFDLTIKAIRDKNHMVNLKEVK